MSNLYASPLMEYLPVSPVAPPKSTTVSLLTRGVSLEKSCTHGGSVAEAGERGLAFDFYYIHCSTG